MEKLICSRTLNFRKLDSEEFRPITVGVATPEPTTGPTGETYACCITYLGSPESRHEVFGVDALVALGTALSSIDAYLGTMSKLGKLYWEDGREYSAEGDSPLGWRSFMADVTKAFNEGQRKTS